MSAEHWIWFLCLLWLAGVVGYVIGMQQTDKKWYAWLRSRSE